MTSPEVTRKHVPFVSKWLVRHIPNQWVVGAASAPTTYDKHAQLTPATLEATCGGVSYCKRPQFGLRVVAAI
jgi:hypothetical protein